MRDATVLSAPTQAICNNCSSSSIGLADVSWPCGGGFMFPNQIITLGVATHGQCLRVGENSAATEAYWQPVDPELKLTATVCCR